MKLHSLTFNFLVPDRVNVEQITDLGINAVLFRLSDDLVTWKESTKKVSASQAEKILRESGTPDEDIEDRLTYLKGKKAVKINKIK